MSTPAATCRWAMTAATRAGTARPISRGPSSITVTRQPSAAAELASSSPMNPPPITATRRPGVSRPRSATESAWVRRTWTGAPSNGRRRARAPVASSSDRYGRRRPSASTRTCAAVSRPAACAPGRKVMSACRSAPESQIGLSSPVLDSGGRSYGGDGSAPAKTIRPSQPCSRSANAARVPHSPAPAITIAGAAVIPGISRPRCRPCRR